MKLRIVSALAGVLVVAAGAALAQGASAVDQPALFNSLTACRKVTDESARLRCYDSATAALDAAAATGEIVVVDREQANKVRRQAFGFSLPSLSILDRPERAARASAPGASPSASSAPVERLDELVTTLKSARLRADGNWLFELEDGATWVQTDGVTLRKGAEPGAKLEIRKNALGGYFMNVDGQRAVRVTRLK